LFKTFVEHKGWSAHPVLRELFSAYCRAGHIRVNELLPQLVHSCEHGPLPLESAIIKNSIETFDALFDHGANISLLPSPLFVVSGLPTIEKVIAVYWSGEAGHQLSIALTAGSMRQRIAAGVEDCAGADVTTLDTAPNRRRMGV
jgi:hypothetical protein